VIAERVGNPDSTPGWQWVCGFYPNQKRFVMRRKRLDLRFVQVGMTCHLRIKRRAIHSMSSHVRISGLRLHRGRLRDLVGGST
jgi:hypothetical protein